MYPMDPYSRLSRTQTWTLQERKVYQKKKAKHDAAKAAVIAATAAAAAAAAAKSTTTKHNHVKLCNKFNPQIMDTFCFRWPEMHSYILVRVLESTIAILPVRSRLAFLYFHHAPLPSHPSPQELRKATVQHHRHSSSKRIQGMFRNWKHTLALEDSSEDKKKTKKQDVQLVSDESETSEQNQGEQSDTSDSVADRQEHRISDESIHHDSVSSRNSSPSTPPNTPRSQADVTLSDVLSYESSLQDGWIHAPCTINDGENMYDNNIVLTTEHTVLKLIARCFTEKMMLINLVKLKQRKSQKDVLDQENKSVSINSKKEIKDLKATDMLKTLQQQAYEQLETIQALTSKIELAKEDISNYTHQLLNMDRSLDDLMDNNLNNLHLSSLKRVLETVDYQLSESVTAFHSHRERVSQLQKRVSVHNTFLKNASQRFEQVKIKVRNHAWYPWLYTGLVALVIIIPIIVSYCLFSK